MPGVAAMYYHLQPSWPEGPPEEVEDREPSGADGGGGGMRPAVITLPDRREERVVWQHTHLLIIVVVESRPTIVISQQTREAIGVAVRSEPFIVALQGTSAIVRVGVQSSPMYRVTPDNVVFAGVDYGMLITLSIREQQIESEDWRILGL